MSKHEIKKVYKSTKTYTHSVGLSAAFRQWKATHSHCSFLHGYALQVELVFRATELDEKNWVVDFGGLKQIKKWLVEQFDHKTLVAKDDPQISIFKELHIAKIIDLNVVDAVGCERFSEMIFDYVQDFILENYGDIRVVLESVEVREHGGNSGICQRKG